MDNKTKHMIVYVRFYDVQMFVYLFLCVNLIEPFRMGRLI